METTHPQAITSSNTDSFVVHHSNIDGQCLFTIISETLLAEPNFSEYNVTKIKNLCHNYAKENADKWVKSEVLKYASNALKKGNLSHDNAWRTYLQCLKFTMDDVVKFSASTNPVEKIVNKQINEQSLQDIVQNAICGHIGFEGRMLSEMLNIKICLASVDKYKKYAMKEHNCLTIYLLDKKNGHYKLINVSGKYSQNIQLCINSDNDHRKEKYNVYNDLNVSQKERFPGNDNNSSNDGMYLYNFFVVYNYYLY